MDDNAYFLHIAADHLCAALQATSTCDDDIPVPQGTDLTALLDQVGIANGRDEPAVHAAQTLIDRGEQLSQPIILAKGSAPVVGHRGMQPCFPSYVRQIVVGDADNEHSTINITFSPLVRKGARLTKPAPPALPQAGTTIFGAELACPAATAHSPIPGEHVTVNDDDNVLIAEISGYPVFSVHHKGTNEHLQLGIHPLITVTHDRMQAILHLWVPPTGSAQPDLVTILESLDEQGICYGRLQHALTSSLHTYFRKQQLQETVVALGAVPVKGQDARLRFALEVGFLPGKVMGNGEIDFRERNMFIAVNKDQLIAHKVPASPGIPGTDVYGSLIDPLPGKDISVRAMDDAALDERSGEIRALRSGVLSLVTENSVKVCSRQVISQDIDYQTGNIISRNAVEIKGSIRPKFKVNALGDVMVGGDVEKAQVRSDGNALIKGGLVGKLSTIHARGDVDLGFIVQGRVHSGHNIILRQHGSYCRLHAGGDVHCNPSTRVIAAQLVAHGSITVGTIGSDIATPTILAAAVAPVQLQRYYELRRIINEQSEAIDSLCRHHGQKAAGDELEELIESLEENRKLFTRLNLCFSPEHEPADRGLSHALSCSIIIKGKVFAGTEIRLGNSRMPLPMTMSNVSFRLQEPTGDNTYFGTILTIPNKK